LIQEKEQTEQPGKNAVTHSCEMLVTDPADEECVVRCLIIAILQCAECAAWLCGTEELDHSIVCARCDGIFCPEHYQSHRLANRCLEVTVE
jgi:hypothetical protein